MCGHREGGVQPAGSVKEAFSGLGKGCVRVALRLRCWRGVVAVWRPCVGGVAAAMQQRWGGVGAAWELHEVGMGGCMGAARGRHESWLLRCRSSVGAGPSGQEAVLGQGDDGGGLSGSGARAAPEVTVECTSCQVLDVLGFCICKCSCFRACDELVFVLTDVLVLVLVPVLGYVLVQVLFCVPVEQHFHVKQP